MYNNDSLINDEITAIFNIDTTKQVVLSNFENVKIGYIHFKDNGPLGYYCLLMGMLGGVPVNDIPYLVNLMSELKGVCVASPENGLSIILFIPSFNNSIGYYESKSLSLSEFNSLRLVDGDYNLRPIKPTIYHINHLLSEAIYLEPDYSNYVNKVIIVGNFTINESYPEQIFVFSGYNTNTNDRQVSITDPGNYQFRYELGKLTINKTY
jgi:hypothetical protein